MAGWFTSESPEHVRIAQSVAVVRYHWATVSSILTTMGFTFVLQLHGGFGWLEVTWHVLMGALVLAATASWRRLRNLPPPVSVSPRRIRKLTLFAAAYGVGWGAALIFWAAWPGPGGVPFVLAFSAGQMYLAVSIFPWVPVGLIALTLSILAASLVVLAQTLPRTSAEIAGVFLTLNTVGVIWFLRTNWLQFVRVVDVNMQKARLLEMLQEQKEVAERAVEQKSRFLAAASHDLRQPMHAISLYLGGLSELDLPERVRRAVNDARECAHDMNEMFRSLLDISRLDSQQTVPRMSVFCIATVLSRVEKEFTPIAQSRGVRLKVRARDAYVYSDPVMVERIALNFVSNAVRYAPGGRVLVGCRLRGDTLRLAVYDDGSGIPEKEQDAIFTEFYRVDSARQPDRTGLGLGLAIVRRLTSTLHLPVVVRSAPGRGSMFAVDLPLVHVAKAAAPERRNGTGAGLAGKLVVLVDDEVSILHAATFILEMEHCCVIAARSGSEAMALLAHSARVPDAIICDYDLRNECDGTAVIRALREEFNCDIPSLLVTGDTGRGEVERLAQNMGVPLLYKPLESEALRNWLELLPSFQE